MKYLILLSLLALPLHAQYQKPQLLALYAGMRAWNAPQGVICFTSEPLVTANGVYLGCQDTEGVFMAHWSGTFNKLAKAHPDRLFSLPLVSQNKVSWHEFDESGIRRLFEVHDSEVKISELKNIGLFTDSLVPLSHDSWIYRSRNEQMGLWMWKEGRPSLILNQKESYIFPPYADEKGGAAFKVREKGLSESHPDRLWLMSPELKVVLEDKDANAYSSIKSFRHQVAVDGGMVAVVATDEKGEVLLLIEKGSYKEIARAGVELKSFDFFAPKLKDKTLVIRGVDFENRKAIWVYRDGQFSRLVTEGDVIQTDFGAARISYPNQDALFYGASGIGPGGEVVQQVTLTDIDYPTSLLGIGLIRFVPAPRVGQ